MKDENEGKEIEVGRKDRKERKEGKKKMKGRKN